MKRKEKGSIISKATSKEVNRNIQYQKCVFIIWWIVGIVHSMKILST